MSNARTGGAAVLAALLAATSLTRADAPSDDLAARSPAIRWPRGFDPQHADLFAHNEIAIGAPCARVWEHLIAAPRWPRWYANASEVVMAGAAKLRPGTTFRWKTFGLAVQSQVVELDAPSRLAWSGKTDGIDAYHTWLLVPDGGGCRVVTEEVAHGAGARALVKKDPLAMHRGHQLWLESLKKVAER
jgi:uncharacterized protein YndB with AHSA1/START domain